MTEQNERKYVSDNVQLMAEWDWEKNSDVLPSELTVGSNKKVWWIGKCDHSWESAVKERNRGYGCPICAGKRVVDGVNDLGSNYPDIALQWDFSKNNPLVPSMVAAKSHKRVWWICDKEHSYISSIDNRVRGRGCPYCSRKIVIAGENDLESQNPFLAKEYSSKNQEKAGLVFARSHKKVLWKCTLCGNEWKATVDSRMAGNGCPTCAKRTQTSFPEQAIYFYIKQSFPDAISRYTTSSLENMEIDIFIPSLKIGIEYDGKHWHENSVSVNRELRKYELCKKLGIKLLRIRETDGKNERIANYTIIASDNLDYTINSIRKYISFTEDVDTERDKIEILSNYIQSKKKNSFAAKHPNLAKEWDCERNEGLTPDMFSEFSTQAKFWWKCSNGHYWQSTIAHRVGMKSNCPFCSNRKLLKGYNDFLTTNQNMNLILEWNFYKNGMEGIFPDEITEGSNKKVWWKCQNEHSWQATIYQRKRGSGCPICSGHTVLAGYNDLQTTHPKLIDEWNYDKNFPLLPSEVSFGSNKKIWWVCGEGHEWEAMILSRSRGSGCPKCAKQKHKSLGKTKQSK